MRESRARHITPEGFNGFDPHAFAPDADRAIAERSRDEMVAFNRRSAKTHSGIWRDIAVRKRRTDTEAQPGPILTLRAEARYAPSAVSLLIVLLHGVEGRKLALCPADLDLLKA